MAHCTGCADCLAVASGSYCASYCNAYTCGMAVCKGCVACGTGPGVGEVVNMINDLWRAFEFGDRAEWVGYGTDSTQINIPPMSFTGMAAVWDGFRASLGPETHWQYGDGQHRVSLEGKTCSYSLTVFMKGPFSFPYVNLTQGTLSANGAGLISFDANWKVATLWQQSYVDQMLGATAGTYPTPESPFMTRASIMMLPLLSLNPTAAEVTNMVNDFWRAFEFGYRDVWVGYGTATTQVNIPPMTFVGIATVWDGFRAGLGPETSWQYYDTQHRVSIVGKTCSYSLRVIMKQPFSFPYVNLTQGMLTANGAGLMTFDMNWKVASIWQQSYVDKMLGATGGTYPTPESPYLMRSAILPLPLLSSTPSVGDVINMCNDLWRAFEFGYRDVWVGYGTAATEINIPPMSFTGMATVWDGFRAGLGAETHWQYTDTSHRVDLVKKTITYSLHVFMKDPFSFPYVNLTQGDLTANGAGLMTFDENWKLKSLWQQSYVDKMLGATTGTYPTPESPFYARSSLGMLPKLKDL